MDDNQLWAHFWRSVFVFLAVTVATVGGCCSNTVYQTRIAMESGADPIKTACALTTMSETTCVTAILKTEK